jgi:hypothetical protein
VNKVAAIELLVGQGWTKADAGRALEGLNFKLEPDELTVLRAASCFSGEELYKRQRLQAAQKGMVTKKTKQINLTLEANQALKSSSKELSSKNEELTQVNDELKKDNKALKTTIDQIRLRLALDIKRLMQFEDSEIRRQLLKWYSRTQG